MFIPVQLLTNFSAHFFAVEGNKRGLKPAPWKQNTRIGKCGIMKKGGVCTSFLKKQLVLYVLTVGGGVLV